MRHEGMTTMDAMWMIIAMIFIGALLGLLFHHWPLPVNESVLITSKSQSD